MSTLSVPSRAVFSRLPLVRFSRALALGSLGLVPLLAQPPAENNASAEDPIALPTYTVGATLRTEPLLSIPVAVSVVSGQHLLDANLNSLGPITAELPSLTFRAGASNKDTSLLIRGVGTITTSPGTEPDVSTVVDGVVLARPGQATLDLVDVDHIEILRGPQGTLFGKNSSVGVVSVISKDPSAKNQGFVDAAYFGGGHEVTVHAGASGPLVPDKLLISVSGLYAYYDGNVQNVFLNRTVNGYQHDGARAKLVWTPNTNLKGTFILNFVHSYATVPNDGPFITTNTVSFPSGVINNASPALVAAVLPVVPSLNNKQVKSGLLPAVTDNNGGASAQFDYTVGEFKITSITAYQHWDNEQYEDTGVVAQPTTGQTLSWDHGRVWFDQYSEELRLTSPTGHLVDYVAGLYFQRAIDTETYHRDIIQQPTDGNQVPNFGEAHYGTHGNNVSAYGEGTWNILPRFRVITGLRLTHDTLNFYHQRIASSPVAVPGIQPTLPIHSGSENANGVSGRFGLQYDVAKDIMAYATYSKGYKGPAYNVFFNQTALQVAGLQPEKSNSGEIGLKALTFHQRIQFTVAAFNTVFTNYQANFQTLVVGTPVTNLINAGQVSSRGVEIDASARVTSQFTLSASAAAINAKIDSFNTPAGAVNVNGQPLPFAPHFKSNVGGTYRLPLTNKLKLIVDSNFTYTSKTQFSLTETPDTVQKGYGIWNASVALADAIDGWRVSLLVKNIADKHYATYIAQVSNFDWRVTPRDTNRYFGVAIHKDF